MREMAAQVEKKMLKSPKVQLLKTVFVPVFVFVFAKNLNLLKAVSSPDIPFC